MNISLHLPALQAVLFVTGLISIYNVVRAAVDLLSVFGNRANGKRVLTAFGHVRRKIIRLTLQVIIFTAVAMRLDAPGAAHNLTWLVTILLSIDTLGDWHDRRVLLALLTPSE